jgi:hypothetical protein
MKDLSPESAVTESLIYNNNFWYFLDIKTKVLNEIYSGAGATFDWLFFDNSKLIDFDD